MKKYLLTLVLFSMFCNIPAKAFDPSAFITQSAEISEGGYFTVIFDSAFDNDDNSISLPFFEVRHVVGDRFRLGLLTDLKYSQEDGSTAFGFGNVISTFEAKLLEKGVVDYASFYNNIEFPTAHSELLSDDKYSFEFGLTIQESFLGKFTFFSETGYKLNDPNIGPSFSSLVSNQAIVYGGLGRIKPYIESLLELSTSGPSSVRLLPGLTIPINEDLYTYLGFPIGLNNETPDYGFLAGFTMNF